MYKDKVDDEEYLLGRRIDSSSLNDPEPTTNGSWHYFYFCVLFLRLSFESIFSKLAMPSLLWHCWLGSRKVLASLSVWVRCRFAYGSADVTATHCLLLQQNADWFYLSDTESPGNPGQSSEGRKTGVCVLVNLLLWFHVLLMLSTVWVCFWFCWLLFSIRLPLWTRTSTRFTVLIRLAHCSGCCICLSVCLLRHVSQRVSLIVVPGCLFGCLFVCLSVIPWPTAYHDWSITTKFGMQVHTCPRTRVSLFGSPVSHTLGSRWKNMENFAYFQL